MLLALLLLVIYLHIFYILHLHFGHDEVEAFESCILLFESYTSQFLNITNYHFHIIPFIFLSMLLHEGVPPVLVLHLCLLCHQVFLFVSICADSTIDFFQLHSSGEVGLTCKCIFAFFILSFYFMDNPFQKMNSDNCIHNWYSKSFYFWLGNDHSGTQLSFRIGVS